MEQIKVAKSEFINEWDVVMQVQTTFMCMKSSLANGLRACHWHCQCQWKWIEATTWRVNVDPWLKCVIVIYRIDECDNVTWVLNVRRDVHSTSLLAFRFVHIFNHVAFKTTILFSAFVLRHRCSIAPFTRHTFKHLATQQSRCVRSIISHKFMGYCARQYE